MAPASDPLPSSLESLGRSLRMGYRTSPALILVAFATAVAAAAPDSLFAWALAQFVTALAHGNHHSALLACGGLGGLAVASWLLKLVGERANRRFADRAAVVIESHIARLQGSIDTIEHQERSAYVDRLSVLRDHASALSDLYQQLFAVLGAVIRLVLTVGLLMSVHPALGLLGVFAAPTVWAANLRADAEKKVEEAGAPHDRLARHMFLLGTSDIYGKEVRIAGVQDWLQKQRQEAWLRRYRPQARTRWISAALNAAAYALFAAASVAAVVLVAEHSHSAARDTTLVLAAAGRLSQYINQTATQTHFFRTIWLDCSRRLAWLEDLTRLGESRADVPVPERLREGIALDHVSFAYPGTDRPVLTDVSLRLPAGSVVAVVGENGAGKSSLVKLLCRFYTPTSGRITVDGADLGRLPATDWRRRVSGAFQDFVKFEFPARTTVGVGDLARIHDESAVRTAINRAGAESVVAGLDHGLDTQLGTTWEAGTDLSQGQWQKLALARAFMRDDPLLLVLDEPTSALDAETEHALFERYASASRRAAQGGTGQITLLVSHRFSTVQMADQIIVLDGARAVEVGTHDELMARGGQYAELYGIQAASYQTNG